jgi:hypothetical protein
MKIVRNKVIVSFYMKLKVYNKKVIDFVWENMNTCNNNLRYAIICTVHADDA